MIWWEISYLSLIYIIYKHTSRLTSWAFSCKSHIPEGLTGFFHRTPSPTSNCHFLLKVPFAKWPAATWPWLYPTENVVKMYVWFNRSCFKDLMVRVAIGQVCFAHKCRQCHCVSQNLAMSHPSQVTMQHGQSIHSKIVKRKRWEMRPCETCRFKVLREGKGDVEARMT